MILFNVKITNFLTSTHLLKYYPVNVGDYPGWWCSIGGSRHPVQDLESCHVGGVCPGPEHLNQNDGTECFDPQPGQENSQRDPDGES